MLKRVRAGLARVEAVMAALAGLSLVLMMLSISADAAGRYLFDRPVEGAYEMTGLYFMVMAVYLMLSANHAGNHHVRLDAAAGWLRRRLGRFYDRLLALIGLLAFLPLGWAVLDEGVERLIAQEVTFGPIAFPVYLSYVWVPLGVMPLILRLVLDLVQPEAPQDDGA